MITKLATSGITSMVTQSDLKRIKSVNILSLVCASFGLISVFFDSYMGLPVGAIMIDVFITVVFLTPILLNNARYYKAASIFFLVMGYLVLFTVALSFGPATNAQNFLIVAPGAPLILLGNHQKNIKWFFVLLAAPLWFSVEWYFEQNEPLLVISEESAFALKIFTDILVLTLTMVMFIVLIKQNDDQLNSIKKQSERLETLNRELKDYNSIVSHDMKAPLKNIKGLVDLIEQKHSEDLSKDVEFKFSMIKQSARKMDQLISDILEYSQLYQSEKNHELTSSEQVLREVKQVLEVPESYKITVSDLPEVKCCRTQLSQAFSNLISNAIKYSDKSKGTLHITAHKENDEVKFIFKDNGPGVPEKYSEKIFQKFNTGSVPKSENSTGIGLAIVKKVAANHGGDAGVENNAEGGATFWFSIAT